MRGDTNLAFRRISGGAMVMGDERRGRPQGQQKTDQRSSF
jgi:hypothetical protein